MGTELLILKMLIGVTLDVDELQNVTMVFGLLGIIFLSVGSLFSCSGISSPFHIFIMI